ncbi:hypothetical protein HYI12_05645 [Acinetobacter sp. SwsAc3]|nr:hypothetical protein [Acinetobacter sp. SwsAc3]
MKIIHVTKVPLDRSSRVLSQINLGSYDYEVLYLDNFFESIKAIFKLRNQNIIFHQQATLVVMIFAAFLNLFLKNKNNIIYDMHDLVIFDYAGLYMKLRACLIFILEKFAMLFNIQVMTVSYGLAKIIKQRYNKEALVVYNFPQNYKTKSFLKKRPELYSLKPCYFGIIDEKRIPLKIFEKISKITERKADIYGYISPVSKFSFQDIDFLSYKGRFNPKDMSFLEDYNLLVFVTDRDLNLNYKYCMPNKLFQAVESGLDVLVSEFFEEIVFTFKDAVVSHFIASEVNGVKYLSCNKVLERLDDLFLISERNFLSIVGELR